MCACTTLESDESSKVVWVLVANESHVVNYANYQYHIEKLNLSLGHKSVDIILNALHEKWEKYCTKLVKTTFERIAFKD